MQNLTNRKSFWIGLTLGGWVGVGGAEGKTIRMLDFKPSMEWTYRVDYQCQVNCGTSGWQSKTQLMKVELRLTSISTFQDQSNLDFRVRLTREKSSEIWDTTYIGKCEASGKRVTCGNDLMLGWIFMLTDVDTLEFLNVQTGNESQEERLLDWLADTVYFRDETRVSPPYTSRSDILYFQQGIGTVKRKGNNNGYRAGSVHYDIQLTRFNGVDFDMEKFLWIFLDAYRKSVGIRGSRNSGHPKRGAILLGPAAFKMEFKGRYFQPDGRSLLPGR